MIVSLHGASENIGFDSGLNLRKGVWNSITSIKNVIASNNLNLENLFQRDIANGDGIRFWLDVWNGDDTLANRFPRLAALDTNRTCSIKERITRTANGYQFCGSWRRNIREGREAREIEEVENLCKTIPNTDEEGGWK